jgi:DNA processing protein
MNRVVTSFPQFTVRNILPFLSLHKHRKLTILRINPQNSGLSANCKQPFPLAQPLLRCVLPGNWGICGTDAFSPFLRVKFMIDRIPPELSDHLKLALVPELGPRRTANLLGFFKTPAAVLSASEAELSRVELIGTTYAARFYKAFREVDVANEWRLMQKHNVTAIPLGSPDYPEALAQISNAPPLLYFKSQLTEQDRNGIAIVGSRTCSSYGRRITQQIVRDLVAQKWTIYSGLARGIDGVAHEAALEAGGRTIAVLAGGLSAIYPPEHDKLAERIASEHGALISETPMTLKPQAGMFPARNRIVSALSRAVVIIEANLKSGALITANHAADQGREVFVIPGNVDSPTSAGCLDLIRKGARLIRSAADILEDLAGLSTDTIPAKKPTPRQKLAKTLFEPTEPVAEPLPAPRPAMSEVEGRLWDLLDEPKQADSLARESGIGAAELGVILMKMQMKKLILRLPGNIYERSR